MLNYLREIMQVKKCLIAVAAMAICFQFNSTAQAVILLEETFDYADGALDGQNGGVGFSGAWAAGPTVTSGEAVVSGDGNSLRTLDFTFGNTGELWGKFDLDVPADENSYAGLSFFSTSTGLSGRTEKALIGDRFGSDVWGISVPFGPFDNAEQSTSGLKTGGFKITLGTGLSSTIDIWVADNTTDTIDVGFEPDATLTGLELDIVDQIRLGHGGSGAYFDNIFLADSFSDLGFINAGPAEPAIPGDVNDDGNVDISDYIIIRDNFRANVANFTEGDLSGPDGSRDFVVDFYDFSAWATEFEAAGGNMSLVAAIPEPASLLLAALAAIAGCGRVRRNA